MAQNVLITPASTKVAFTDAGDVTTVLRTSSGRFEFKDSGESSFVDLYANDIVLDGNLTVGGTTTTVNTSSVLIEDPILQLAKGQTSGTPTVEIGFLGLRGASNNAAFIWDESDDVFAAILTTADGSGTTLTPASYAGFKAGLGNFSGTTNDGSAAPLTVTQAGTARAVYVTRNVASATRAMADFAQLHSGGGAHPALHIQQTTTASDALRITSDGAAAKFAVTGTGALTGTNATFSGTGTGATSLLYLNTANDASIGFRVSGQAANNRLWDFRVNGLNLIGRTLNDAQTVGVSWLNVTRSGNTIASTTLYAGSGAMSVTTAGVAVTGALTGTTAAFSGALTALIGDFSFAASNHTTGLTVTNTQNGGYGTALTFYSKRTDESTPVIASRIRTEGASSWNSDASTSSNLKFETVSADALATRMTIFHDGKVGIGTSAPAEKLEVTGNI
jgi:hypothetical protein